MALGYRRAGHARLPRHRIRIAICSPPQCRRAIIGATLARHAYSVHLLAAILLLAFIAHRVRPPAAGAFAIVSARIHISFAAFAPAISRSAHRLRSTIFPFRISISASSCPRYWASICRDLSGISCFLGTFGRAGQPRFANTLRFAEYIYYNAIRVWVSRRLPHSAGHLRPGRRAALSGISGILRTGSGIIYLHHFIPFTG